MNETFKNLTQFLRTKTIYSIEWDGWHFHVLRSEFREKYDKSYNKETTQLPKRNFVCNIKFGNLLKESGDILLCPLSENFVPSNFLAQSIVRTEGKWLKDKLENLCSLSKSGEQTYEGKASFSEQGDGKITLEKFLGKE